MTATPVTAFRTDASLRIGNGHVMRCLTLADALAERGHACHFICREHDGNLGGLIDARGHRVAMLPAPPGTDDVGPATDYRGWLGVDPLVDASETAALLAGLRPEWLVVDHYALDAQWEAVAAVAAGQVLAIDDLADRPHACHLLLDQTLGRTEADYAGLIPPVARALCGSSYALLRPAFAACAAQGAAAPREPVEHLLVSMGGVDADNLSARALDALDRVQLPPRCRVTVVMGERAPWLAQVRERAARFDRPVDVRTGVADMAALMADCDLAIGAAGSTSWERCCLGLPAVIVVAADNQRASAEALAAAGAASVLAAGPDLEARLAAAVTALLPAGPRGRMADQARRLIDGRGTARVVAAMVDAALPPAPRG